jgi:hypothetical protein
VNEKDDVALDNRDKDKGKERERTPTPEPQGLGLGIDLFHMMFGGHLEALRRQSGGFPYVMQSEYEDTPFRDRPEFVTGPSRITLDDLY